MEHLLKMGYGKMGKCYALNQQFASIELFFRLYAKKEFD